MYLRAARFEFLREGREVLVQMVEGFPLGFRGGLASRLPILERRSGFVARRLVLAQGRLNELPMAQVVRKLPRVRFELAGEGCHDCASTSARSIVFSFLPWRSSNPWSCIRQLESFETMYSAPVSSAEAHLTSPIAVEIMGNFAANVRPKPEQISASFISMSWSSRTFANNSRAGRLLPSSRKPWQPSWNVTLAGKRAPRSVMPSLLTRKSENSQPFFARALAAAASSVPATSSA